MFDGCIVVVLHVLIQVVLAGSFLGAKFCLSSANLTPAFVWGSENYTGVWYSSGMQLNIAPLYHMLFRRCLLHSSWLEIINSQVVSLFSPPFSIKN